MKNLNIFVVTHKETKFSPKGRTFIGVGNKIIPNVDLYDNTKENISKKNDKFCELTALYWIWKNDNSDVVGLEHYRRFFCGKSIFKIKPQKIDKFKKLLKKYDCIVPRLLLYESSVYEQYKKNHDINDLELCKDAISKLYPEYSETFNKVMDTNAMYSFNMFIMRKQLLNRYCKWLFDILFYIEPKVDIKTKDDYQKRVFGFLSERLFTVWLLHNNLKLYECNVYRPDEIPFIKLIKRTAKKILYRKS